MNDTPRWLIVVLLLVLVVGLIAYARGHDHHRGPQEVGALGSGVPAASTAIA
jgi:hypothetical protein